MLQFPKKQFCEQACLPNDKEEMNVSYGQKGPTQVTLLFPLNLCFAEK